MIANLPMYNAPTVERANKTLWREIHSELTKKGVDAPKELSHHAESLESWRHPDLVFSQTCGLPFRAALHDHVQLIGTPDYGIEGCAPGYYQSYMIVREDDPRIDVIDFKNAPWAINGYGSQSGYAAAIWTAKDVNVSFDKPEISGGHLMSMECVRKGGVDFAFIDAVTWRLSGEAQNGLRILCKSPSSPGLPFITSKKMVSNIMFEAVACAINTIKKGENELGLRGLISIPADDYLAYEIPTLSMKAFEQ